jgi:hypothetical protein
MQGHDAERDNKNHLTNERGQAPRCDDEMLLAMLDVNLGDLVSDGFDQGRRMGCDEERKRTRHFLQYWYRLADPFGLSSASISDSSPQHVR